MKSFEPQFHQFQREPDWEALGSQHYVALQYFQLKQVLIFYSFIVVLAFYLIQDKNK